jgi:hypothetical protein
MLQQEFSAKGGQHGDHVHDTGQLQAEDEATAGDYQERRVSWRRSSTS